MKRLDAFIRAAAFLGAVAAAAGCATVRYSSPKMLKGIDIQGAGGPPERLVLVDTSGFYFLWTIPIVSGDMRWNEKTRSIEGGTVFFRDMVGLDELQNALVKIAESQNCDLVDISVQDSDTSYAEPSYEGAVGLLFGSSRLCASAVLVPRDTRDDVLGVPAKGEQK